MITLNDFEVGTKAFIFFDGNDARGISDIKDRIKECTVTKIGKKYVTVDFQERQFYFYDNWLDGLIDKNNTSQSRLFPSEQSILDELERLNTIKDIKTLIEFGSRCSLAQLKTVAEILMTDDNAKKQLIKRKNV